MPDTGEIAGNALPAEFAPYQRQLAQYLGATRLRHSVNVALAARELALRFAPQLADKAALAGLLHDNAKRLPGSELTRLAAKLDIEVSAVERAWPALLHGKVGAALLSERFGLADLEVAQAMADHVTGRPGMGMLSRILFVADQSALDRDFPGVAQLREIAQQNLEQAVAYVSRFKLQYALQRGRLVEPTTVAVYNEYLHYLSPGA
jgi:predicted HD superfamily hydrolase involved in NAD metabolism